uniref:Uncharacterized protein n=1 Tax=Setaria italica TaxID=4555 RepID=K3XPD8_SETIT
MTSRRRLLHPPSTTPHLLTQLRAAAHARALTQNRYVCRRSPLAPGTAPASLPRTTENTATPLPKLPSSRHSRTVSLSARLSSSRLSLARSCSPRPRSRSSRATLPSLLTLQLCLKTAPRRKLLVLLYPS